MDFGKVVLLNCPQHCSDKDDVLLRCDLSRALDWTIHQIDALTHSLPNKTDQDETQFVFDCSRTLEDEILFRFGRSCALEATTHQLLCHSVPSDLGDTPDTKVDSFAMKAATIDGLGSGLGKSFTNFGQDLMVYMSDARGSGDTSSSVP